METHTDRPKSAEKFSLNMEPFTNQVLGLGVVSTPHRRQTGLHCGRTSATYRSLPHQLHAYFESGIHAYVVPLVLVHQDFVHSFHLVYQDRCRRDVLQHRHPMRRSSRK